MGENGKKMRVFFWSSLTPGNNKFFLDPSIPLPWVEGKEGKGRDECQEMRKNGKFGIS